MWSGSVRNWAPRPTHLSQPQAALRLFLTVSDHAGALASPRIRAPVPPPPPVAPAPPNGSGPRGCPSGWPPPAVQGLFCLGSGSHSAPPSPETVRKQPCAAAAGGSLAGARPVTPATPRACVPADSLPEEDSDAASSPVSVSAGPAAEPAEAAHPPVGPGGWCPSPSWFFSALVAGDDIFQSDCHQN